MNNISFIPVQKKSIIAQDVDGETLLLNNQGAEVHQLNEVASLIWKNCDGQHSIESIGQIIAEQYAILFEQAIDDVSEAISQLESKGLLEEVQSKNDT